MLTIREDALSLEFLRTKPNSLDLLEAVLDEESLFLIDELPMPKVLKLVSDAIKRVTGASLQEILGLVDLLNEYESAITYDCLTVGMRLNQLGTHNFTWGELLAIVQCSPRSSAFYRAQNPDEWMWDEKLHLLAAAVDALNVANWQRSDTKKNRFPKPIQRPGVKTDDVKTYGKGAIPYDEMADWLGGPFSSLNN